MPDARPDLDALLGHRAFVRAVARAAIRGDAEIDDVVQDTWMAALGADATTIRSPRSWLAAVVRRQAALRLRRRERLERRHAEHARRGSAPRAVPSPDEVAERVETGRMLAAAVLRLPAIHRDPILLRYYENLPPRAIALRLALPVETVRSQIRRGLATLREDLDRRHGADTLGWRQAVLPLVLPDAAASPVLLVGGGLAVKKIVTLLLLLACLAGGIWWIAQDRAVAPRGDGERGDLATTTLDPARGDAKDEGTAPEPTDEAASLAGMSGRRAADAHEASPPAGVPDGIPVTGRVVDPRRFPVAGVPVVACGVDRPEVEARTDESGRFRLVLAPPQDRTWEAVQLLARRADDRAGVQVVTLGAATTDPVDAGTLVLEPGFALEVEVEPSAGARLPAAVLLQGWSLHSLQVVARGTTDATGRVTLPVVPRGSYRVLAVAPGAGRAVVVAALPQRGEGALTITLPPPRDVNLRFVVAETGDPVVGVVVRPWEMYRGAGWRSDGPYPPGLEVAPTDAEGRTRIEGLGKEDDLLLDVRAEGFARADPQAMRKQGIPRVRAGETDVTIELSRPRRVSWPVTAADGPVPADGTVVRLGPMPGAMPTTLPAEARMEGGHLVAVGIGPGFVNAHAATGGRIARLFAGADAAEGSPISFRPARTIRVTLVYPDGKPAVGLFVVARNQGNNLLHAPVETDDAGVAVIEQLYGQRADVYVVDAGNPYVGQRIGTVHLQARGADLEGEVQRLRPGRLRILVDGKPALPAHLSILVGGRAVQDVVEDPATGEVRFLWRPKTAGAKGRLVLNARGCVAPGVKPGLHGTEGSVLLVDAGDGVDAAEIHLTRGGTLRGRVILPADRRISFLLQRWDAARERWELQWGGWDRRGAVDAEGGILIEGLLPGRYRVLDRSVDIVSESVDVSAGRSAEVALDLGRVGWVRGRVEVPEGHDVSRVRVRMEGARADPLNPATKASGAGVSKDGLFGLRVPGDRPIALSPVHPTLVPAVEGGCVTVTHPQKGVVLRMVEGARATLRLDPPPERPFGLRERTLSILLFRGGTGDDPALRLKADLREGRWAFGGFEPGTYTVWIDAWGFVPAVLRNVKLGAGTTDLGTVELDAGSEVHVTLLVPEGQDPPRVSGGTRFLGRPVYTREIHSRGESRVVLKGLATGRHAVTLFPTMGQAKGLREEIEVDGREVVERTIDLR